MTTRKESTLTHIERGEIVHTCDLEPAADERIVDIVEAKRRLYDPDLYDRLRPCCKRTYAWIKS